MKLVIEVRDLKSGHKKGVDGPDKAYARVVGPDGRGRFAAAVLFDHAAEALAKTLAERTPEGAEIASKRFVVELVGDWREGREKVRNGETVRRADGTAVRDRFFHARSFNVLAGPSHELSLLRREARTCGDEARQLLEAGRLDEAVLVLQGFADRACGRQFDLDAALTADADQDTPDPVASADAPEEAAAARFGIVSTTEPSVAHDPAPQADVEPPLPSNAQRRYAEPDPRHEEQEPEAVVALHAVPEPQVAPVAQEPAESAEPAEPANDPVPQPVVAPRPRMGMGFRAPGRR